MEKLVSPIIKSVFVLSRQTVSKRQVLTKLCEHPRQLLALTATCLRSRYSTVASEVLLPEDDSDRLLSQVTLKVRGSDEAVLDSYTQFVQRAANVLNLDISGKVVLPRHIEKRTLLKSPHVYKKHRVQYELRTHGRMLQIHQITGDTSDIFLEYVQRNLPEGVSMSIEQTELESLPEYLKQPPDDV